MTIDIIIPSWNKSDYALRCLDAVAANTSMDYRVIFVDNGSDGDHLWAVRNRLRVMPHLLIELPTNLGFVKATNIGIAAAEGDVVLLNNDTEVPPGWLEELHVAAIVNDYGIVGPLADEDCESWQAIDNARRSFGELPRPGIARVDGMVAFFCAYIRRDVIRKIGYLSEAFGVGFGDDDYYCWLARKNGFAIGLVTNVVVKHAHRTTFKTLYPDSYKDMQDEAMKTLKRMTT